MRSLAARACDLGRIHSNGQPAKPAREARIGDMLRVTNDGGDFEVEVLLLSKVRGPASVAQTLYRETEASQELRLKVAAERRARHRLEEHCLGLAPCCCWGIYSAVRLTWALWHA